MVAGVSITLCNSGNGGLGVHDGGMEGRER